MKKTVLLISGLLLATMFSYGQEQEIQLDQVEIRCLYEFTQTVKNKNETYTVTDSMMLEIGRNHSVYYNWLKELKNSLWRSKMPDVTAIKSISILKDQSAADYTPSTTGDSFEKIPLLQTARLYKDRAKKEVTTIDTESGSGSSQTLKCIEEIVPRWELTADTMTVIGYHCQGATTSFRGRKYTAWFTMEIPVDDGPWKLYGLPGLVLFVQDDDGLFKFEAIGIENTGFDKAISMPGGQFIKANYKQMERLRQKRLTKKNVWNVKGGDITVIDIIDTSQDYIPLEDI